MACDFDFEEVYGERGKGYIEVHHVVPISKLDGTFQVDPEKHVVVLCANCHRMVHWDKDNVLSLRVEEYYPEKPKTG
jgi:predicted HNH restriction endonuclease